MVAADSFDFEPTKCPACGSLNWACWDESTMTWWQADGHEGAIQVIAGLKCGDCGRVWLSHDPSDEWLQSEGLWCEDEDWRWHNS